MCIMGYLFPLVRTGFVFLLFLGQERESPSWSERGRAAASAAAVAAAAAATASAAVAQETGIITNGIIYFLYTVRNESVQHTYEYSI